MQPIDLNMLKVLITLLILQTSVLSLAQTHTHKFELKKTNHTPNPKISYIKVIDNRLHTDNFGYIIDNSTRRQTLVTDGLFDACLEKFVNANFLSQSAVGTDTILFVLRNLTIEHRPAHTELGTIYIQADFFRGSANQYRQLYHIDSFYQLEHRNTKGILSRMDEIICYNASKAVQDSLSQTKASVHSYDECVLLPEIEKKQYPLYNTSKYKKGIYNNWNDVLMQTPAIKEFTYLEPDEFGNGKSGLFTLDSNGKVGGKVHKKDYYAVYDGSWFIRTKHSAHEMELKNGDFYIKINAQDVQKTVGMGIASAAAMGPIMGGLAMGLATTVFAGYYVMKLDYKTGNLIPVMITQ